MPNETITAQLPPETLAAFRQILREELQAVQAEQLEAKLLSPAEACKLFQPAISRVTLGKWTADGLIPALKIGGRVWYKLSDLTEAGSRLKKYKAGREG